MAQFELGKEIVTADAKIEVEPTLPPGKHVFQLIVEDAAGNQSAPTTLEVIVRDTTAPTAVLELVGDAIAGQPFVLSGAKSVDPDGGQVVTYRWTLISDNGPDPVPPHPIDPP